MSRISYGPNTVSFVANDVFVIQSNAPFAYRFPVHGIGKALRESCVPLSYPAAAPAAWSYMILPVCSWHHSSSSSTPTRLSVLVSTQLLPLFNLRPRPTALDSTPSLSIVTDPGIAELATALNERNFGGSFVSESGLTLSSTPCKRIRQRRRHLRGAYYGFQASRIPSEINCKPENLPVRKHSRQTYRATSCMWKLSSRDSKQCCRRATRITRIREAFSTSASIFFAKVKTFFGAGVK